MRWTVADSLYCPEAFFCSHLDSYSHYLKEAGERIELAQFDYSSDALHLEQDVAFILDRYDIGVRAKTRLHIAQVAAICSPMPWQVRKPDGSPAYDLVVSSIPWMVEEARKHGCRAEYMPLAFDTRARVCGMGAKERDLDCIFVGSVGPNHKRRTALLEELKDIVTVLPPVFGRDYFRTLARAKVVFNVHAEWARGDRNNMRLFESTGMGAACVTDGGDDDITHHYGGYSLPGNEFDGTADDARREIAMALKASAYKRWDVETLMAHTYEHRIPRLIDLVKSL